jgi:Protein of unknown function (DUF3987)
MNHEQPAGNAGETNEFAKMTAGVTKNTAAGQKSAPCSDGCGNPQGDGCADYVFNTIDNATGLTAADLESMTADEIRTKIDEHAARVPKGRTIFTFDFYAHNKVRDALKAALLRKESVSSESSTVGGVAAAVKTPVDTSAIDLHPLACYGFLGRALERIGPATEVRAGVTAMMLITIIGNLFGHTAWTITEARVDGDGHRQYPTFLTAYIGRSSKGRKGTSWNLGKQMMKSALGHTWDSKERITSVASGEGIIHQVRDARSEMKKPSKNAPPVMTLVDEGVRDKRKICVVEEMSLIFNLAARPGNIILDIIRACADCSDLDNPTKNAKEYATDPTVSMITHSTQQALLGNLKADNVTNGVLNRFLWVWTSRNKRLPLGHSVEFHDLGQELAQILAFSPGEVFLSETAKPIWREMYMWLNPEDSDNDIIPIIDSILARAEMYLIRLALVYALLDRSRTIEPRHLQAAWAVWAYSEESARRIFGNSVTDKTANTLIELLKEGDMVSTSIYEAFNGRLLAHDLKQAIKRLPPGTITTYKLEIAGKAPATVYHYDATKAISTIKRAIDAPWLKMKFPDVAPSPVVSAEVGF